MNLDLVQSEVDVSNAIAQFKGDGSAFGEFKLGLINLCKAKGFDRALPETWRREDAVTSFGSYVKASSEEGVLDVLGAPYGGPVRDSDNSGERFSASTNFHESIIPNPVVIYFHGMDETGRAQPVPTVIGNVVQRWTDKAGHWFKVKLDLANEYGRRVWDAAKRGKAAASTGVVPAYKRVDNNGNISSWLVGELSLLDVGDGRRPVNAYAVAVPSMKAEYEKAGISFPTVLERDLVSSVGSDCSTPQLEVGSPDPPCGLLSPLTYVPVTGVCASEQSPCAYSGEPIFDNVYSLESQDAPISQQGITKAMTQNPMESVISNLLTMLWKAKGLTDEHIGGLLKAVFDPPATPQVSTGDLNMPDNVTTHGVVTQQVGNSIEAAHASSTARVQSQTLPPPTPNTQGFVLDPAFVQGVARGTNMGILPPSQPTMTEAGMYGHGINTSNALKAQMDQLAADNASLKAQILGEQAASWVREMTNTGRILPAEADTHKAMYVRLASADSLMKAEGADSGLANWKAMIAARAPQLMITPSSGMSLAGFGTPAGAGTAEGAEMSTERRAQLLGYTTFGQSIVKKN